MKSGEQGAVLISVLIIMLFLNALLYISLMRSQAAFRLVKNRYYDGIVLDLAENGIEFEHHMISQGKNAGPDSPHIRNIGKFSLCSGSFESFSRQLEPDVFEIVSKGMLVTGKGNRIMSSTVKVRLKSIADGKWKTIYRAEKTREK